MIIGIRHVCRTYEFCEIIFGGFWARPMLSRAGGERRDTGQEYHSFILSTTEEKM